MELTTPFTVERSILVVVLTVEMVLGVIGNVLVLLTKLKARVQFKCQCWLPLVSLSLSDLGCSLLIMSSSLLAVLSSGQQSPWCELVSLLKFAFITSSLGSLAVLCVQRATGLTARSRSITVVMATACLASWLTGVAFGSIPVAYEWIRYDPAEMLCAVFWESSYSDMLLYIICAFTICIFPPLLFILLSSLLVFAGWARSTPCRDPEDLSSVTPLLVTCYLLCYSPFALSELILLGRRDLSPAPAWLRTLSSIMAYLDCSLNPLIYCTQREFRSALLSIVGGSSQASSEPVLTALARQEVWLESL